MIHIMLMQFYYYSIVLIDEYDMTTIKQALQSLLSTYSVLDYYIYEYIIWTHSVPNK